ncbi:MAG: cadherin repeat domain-containing protein, partial [Candidatus Micrarchaeota archaeon]|nr:cadherin repeat domain-containing protein [Candidatus Micrarchaeota archaeon]
ATVLYRNLTTYVNSTLFQFNYTNHTMYVNVSVGIMNYTAINNSQVGNFTLNITADDGNANGTTSTLVNFTIYNINDAPVLDSVGNHTAVQDVNFYMRVNATDVDDFPSYVPYNDTINGSITFNMTFISGTGFFGIDNQTGEINFTANSSQTGVYVLNITVTDGGGLVDYEVMNITVVPNNPPVITTTIANQTTTQNQSFYLEFNGTDPDNATQEIRFYTETYYRNMTLVSSTTKFPLTNDNSSWPSAPVVGIMNYTAVNNSQVGNYTVRIILIDTWNVTDYVDVNFTVYNVNDPPSMDAISSPQTSYEDSEFYLDVNVTDIDYLTPYGDTTTFNITFINGTQFFDINHTTGVINFTIENNSYEGNYTINVSASDSGNETTWRTFNLTHMAVNDYPQFANLNLTMTARSLQNFYYDVNATDEEDGNSSLYFNITFINGTQFFDINHTTGEINFTVNDSYIGTYMINFTVTDSGYNSTFQGFLTNRTNTTQVNLTVTSQNVPPQITSWWLFPYQNPDNITLEENESVTILASVTDDNGDSITCTWYVDGVENGDESEISAGGCALGTAGTNARYTPSFQDSGNRTIVLVISDGNATDSINMTINVTNVNRPPVLRYLIGNQTWPMNIDNGNINLSYHFVDPDNENSVSNDDNNLTYSVNVTPSHVTVTIDQNSGKVTLSPENDWHGTDNVLFVVNDSQYTANSSLIGLNVTYVEVQTQTITVSSSGSSSSSTTTTVTVTEPKIASMEVYAAPFIEIKPFEEYKTPLKFVNDGELDLSDIEISVREIGGSEEVEFQLKNKRIDELLVDEQFTTELAIKTLNLTKKEYQVKITGKVTDPEFSESAIIYLRTVPINKTTIDEKIRIVKDMFEENPQCMDLMELIISAEKELGKGNIKKAENLTRLALDNCRDLIRYTSNMTYSRPAYIQANRIPGSIVLVSVIMAIAVVFIATAHYIMTEKKKRNAREEFIKRKKEAERKRHKRVM